MDIIGKLYFYPESCGTAVQSMEVDQGSEQAGK